VARATAPSHESPSQDEWQLLCAHHWQVTKALWGSNAAAGQRGRAAGGAREEATNLLHKEPSRLHSAQGEHAADSIALDYFSPAQPHVEAGASWFQEE